MRKLSADYLFTLEGPPLEKGVLVLDEKGIIIDILESRADLENVEVFNGVLCPGMINAHGHLELSHLKGKIAKGRGMVDFIIDVQAFRNTAAEVIQDALLNAEDELFEQGVVGMGDISNSSDTFLMKSRSRIRYHTFLECFGFQPVRAMAVLEHALFLQKQVRGDSSITPHAPYSVSEKLFREISKTEKGLLSIHNQESLAENQFYKTAEGDFTRLYQTFGIPIDFFRPFKKNSLPVYLSWLANQKKLLVHNTFTSQEDLERLPNRNTIHFCLCPAANLFIEERLPDIPLLLKSRLNLLIGTDSLASNDCLSMISEMELIQNAYPEIGLETLLEWTCRNAAEFFNWSDLGSLRVGKKPGVVLIDGLASGFSINKQTRTRRII